MTSNFRVNFLRLHARSFIYGTSDSLMPPLAIFCSLLVFFLLTFRTASAAAAKKTEANAQVEIQRTVLSFLDQVLDWYRMTKMPPEAPVEPALAVIASANAKEALEVVKIAFQYARARAAMLPNISTTEALLAHISKPGQPANPTDATADIENRRAQIEAEVQTLSSKLNALNAQLGSASQTAKAQIMGQIREIKNKIAVDKVRLDFYSKIEKFQKGSSNPLGTTNGLLEQINDLADTVPELALGKEANVVALATQQGSKTEASSFDGSGIWGRINLLFALQKEKTRVMHLVQKTSELERSFVKIRDELRSQATELFHALETLSSSELSTSDPTVLTQRDRQFESALAELKLLGDAAAPIVAGRSALHRYQAGLNSYIDGVKHSIYRTSGDLVEQGLLLSVVFGFIFLAAMVWRQLAIKYVVDPRRLHQVLVFRTITVIVVSVMVLVFKFATDMAALATFTGFAAAGIAFALQNVILSLVGYFSIIGRNGARVGDKVGLQGPYGYVYGEVQELGLLRITLRELTGGPDNWTPTGRTVVFPNSVVFTGSFLKFPRTPSSRVSKLETSTASASGVTTSS